MIITIQIMKYLYYWVGYNFRNPLIEFIVIIHQSIHYQCTY